MACSRSSSVTGSAGFMSMVKRVSQCNRACWYARLLMYQVPSHGRPKVARTGIIAVVGYVVALAQFSGVADLEGHNHLVLQIGGLFRLAVDPEHPTEFPQDSPALDGMELLPLTWQARWTSRFGRLLRLCLSLGLSGWLPPKFDS